MKIAQYLASLEEIDEAQPVDFVEAAEVETELLDVQREGQEVEEMVEDAEEAEEVIEALESLISSLESIVENGGLDQNAARMYQIAQESIYGRIGITIPATTSLESFSDVSSRHTATVVSLEEEKGRFKKTVDAVIKFVQEIVAKFVSWIKTVFSPIDNAIKRANQLKEKVKVAKEFNEELTDKQKKRFSKLNYGNEDVSIVAASAELKRFAEWFAKLDVFSKFIKLEKDVFDKALNGSSMDDLTKLVLTTYDQFTKHGMERNGGTYKSNVTLGNVQLTLGDGGNKFIGKPSEEPFNDFNINSSSEAVKVLDNVISALNTVKKFSDEAVKGIQEFSKEMKDFASKSKSTEDKETVKKIADATKHARSNASGLVKLSNGFISHNVAYAKLLTDAVGIAAKAGTKEEEA